LFVTKNYLLELKAILWDLDDSILSIVLYCILKCSKVRINEMSTLHLHY
jgi:hypothetical protein